MGTSPARLVTKEPALSGRRCARRIARCGGRSAPARGGPPTGRRTSPRGSCGCRQWLPLGGEAPCNPPAEPTRWSTRVDAYDAARRAGNSVRTLVRSPACPVRDRLRPMLRPPRSPQQSPRSRPSWRMCPHGSSRRRHPGQRGARPRSCAEAFRELGLEPVDVPLDAELLRADPAASPFSWDVSGKRDVVADWLPGAGAPGRSLVLNGHVDVVPPAAESSGGRRRSRPRATATGSTAAAPPT